MQPGEEGVLRLRLRQMEARRASVQRCSIVRTALMGDSGSGGGLREGLRSVQTQLNAVLADEEAYAAVRAGKSKDSCAMGHSDALHTGIIGPLLACQSG